MQKELLDVIKEVKKVIEGKDQVIGKVLLVILAGGHILLEDVPGVGKTTLALGFSKALDLKYKRLQFTPDTMATDITGFSIYNKQTGDLEYKEGAAICNLLLADEINRTSARTQAALLEVMEEGGMTVDGVTHKTGDPFICLATQNPLGSAGTQRLPESQLDRFMVKLGMGYPNLESQVEVVKNRQGINPMDNVKSVLSAEDLINIKKEVSNCTIIDEVIRYAATLCRKPDEYEEVEQGISPRAILALVQLARAKAYVLGRNYVIPKDIKDVFIDVCSHRLILTARARINKVTEKELLTRALSEIKPPAVDNSKVK